MGNLYIFLDEAGDFEFSRKGSKYFILTSVTTNNIMPLATELYNLKHDLISNFRLDIEYFHAHEDSWPIRNRVFPLIAGSNHFRVDAIVAEKPKVYPPLRPAYKFYPRMMGILLKWVYRFLPPQSFSGVFVFMDYLKLAGQREAFLKGAKEAVHPYLRRGQLYAVMLHQSKSHPYLQVADYCGWAIQRYWEHNDNGPRSHIKGLLKSEFNVFELGSERFY